MQHLATVAVVNALWDIWAKKESKVRNVYLTYQQGFSVEN